MSEGRIIRKGHTCALPQEANRKDIWLCNCGRRWECTSGDWQSHIFGLQGPAEWQRYWWPWPRS